MSQRPLFIILFAVLFVACEDDTTLLDRNAISWTKYGLLAGAEYALLTADQADTLAARLAVFADSAAVFADSVYAYADSTLSAEVLFAFNAYEVRTALSKAAASTHYATGKGGKSAVYEACDDVDSSPVVAAADEDYKTARRAAIAAFQAYAAAYDVRNTRLAPRAYKVAQRAAEETASIARRVAAQAATAEAAQAAADSLHVAAQANARRTAEAYATYIDSTDADQASSDKAIRLRRAYKKDAADQAANKAATARRAADQAANKAATARRAADQAAQKAEHDAKVYTEHTTRLRRAYEKDAVKAAYDVACATAYDVAYQAYDNEGLDAADKDAWRVASSAAIDVISFSDKAKRSAYATYVDSAVIAVAYEAAYSLFDAAYRADDDDPQPYAAQAHAAAAKEAGRIAARDSVYVKSPISIATAALAASAVAYRASASYIDSVLKFHQIEFSTAAKDHYSYYGRKFGY